MMVLCFLLILRLFLTAEGYTGCHDLIPIGDDQLSASSSLSNNYLPSKAKLDGPGAWCTTSWSVDHERYIQIDLKKMTNVAMIVTQGRSDYNQWTTWYQLKFSQDGTSYSHILSKNGAVKTFQGNSNRNTKVYQALPYPVTTKYLRLHVTHYYGYPCLRVGIYGCDALSSNGCERYQVENVTDDKLTAISNYNSDLDTSQSRLNSARAWCPSSIHKNNGYIQVEFSQLTNVIGIETQGRSDYQWYVKSYKVMFSQDSTHWHSVLQDDGTEKILQGNWDQNTIMISRFDHVVPMKYLRIYPKSYNGWPCLRFDVIGCTALSSLSCSDYLVSGVDSIPDDQIAASSSFSSSLKPSYGRLSTTTNWCAANTDRYTAYFQVQFQTKKSVTGFLTKGRSNYNSFIVLYSISYSRDGGNTWAFVKKDDGNTRIFFGNKDRTALMLNMLDTPIEADSIRFHSKHVSDRSCGNFEVIGCNLVSEIRSGFYGHFVPMKVDSSLAPYLIWKKNYDITSCIRQCAEDSNCVSFAFNKDNEVCQAFNAQFYRDDKQKPEYSEDLYYIDRSILDQYGYTVSTSSGLCYKIFTTAVSQSDAEKQCRDQKASLLPIRTAAHLQEIKNIIEKNKGIINTGVYVDGTFDATKTTWIYHDKTTVTGALWAASGNNSDVGSCTTVTKDGLTSSNCNNKLFFACGL